MKYISFCLLMTIGSAVLMAQTEKVPVFVSGQDGYKSYRIPAIVSMPDGELLAFCEGRVNGVDDFGNIQIVLRRSMDHGRTWSALQKVADNGEMQTGNAAPVVDLTDPAFPKGRVFLFYNTGNAHEGDVRKGNGRREVWYKTSVDGGRTWSDAVNITAQVHPEDWRSYANTPGHAMQFSSGKYRGRIFVAANHSAGGPQRNFMDYAAHGFYTDDHGRTFHLSATVEMPGGNESTAAELSGDGLMMNSRNQKGQPRRRIVSVSHNGGETWDSSWYDYALPDPVNEGSLLTIGKKGGHAVLAFCNTADTSKRDNLTLRISYDDGRSWPQQFVVDRSPGGAVHGYTGYSDLVRMGRRKIGVLYEKEEYSQIVFTVIGFSYL
jgi:sialidase-1